MGRKKEIARMSEREWKAKEDRGEMLTSLQYLLGFGLVLKKNLEQGSRKGRVGQQWDGRGRTEEAWTWRSRQNAPEQKPSALHRRLFLPCLFPCTIGLINIFRAAGLLRPVSICMTVGSGRRPFPRLTALKRGKREMSAILATTPSVKLDSVQQYHGLSSNESSQHASSRNTRSTEGDPDICPPQQPAIIQPPCLLGHLGCGKLQHRKPPKTSVLTLSQLERRARQGCRHFSSSEKCRVPKCVEVWGGPELRRGFSNPETDGLCN